jgi:hypothetical protein
MGAVAYETDFYGWTLEQADLLQSGKFDKVDLGNLIEELHIMSARERRELINRLRVLMMHLLKWRYQPSYRGRSWELTINNQRDELAIHLEDNPSLTPRIPEGIVKAYPLAKRDAERETGIPGKQFPIDCPWTFEQLMDADFWPEPVE